MKLSYMGPRYMSLSLLQKGENGCIDHYIYRPILMESFSLVKFDTYINKNLTYWYWNYLYI